MGKRQYYTFGLLFSALVIFSLALSGCDGLFGSADEGSDSPAGLDPPYHLVAETNKDGFTVLLSWNMDTGQDYDGFIVERGTPSMNPQEIAMVGPTTLGYGDESTLSPGTYYYRVGAFGEGVDTCYCESVTVEIQ